MSLIGGWAFVSCHGDILYFALGSLVRVLLEQVVSSTIERCVDPVLMERSVSPQPVLCWKVQWYHPQTSDICTIPYVHIRAQYSHIHLS